EKTIGSLRNLCSKTGVALEDPILLDQPLPPRYESRRELAHLEKNLYRIRREVFREEVHDIHMVSCGNPEEETDFVLHKIEELVRTKGYRYRDFAILMGNEEDYPPIFRRMCEKLEIPCFLDSRQKMTCHSGVETVRALFHLAQMDYSYESVFRYLKSGLSGFQGEETDYLENYIFSAGVRGLSAWKQPFSRRLASFTEDNIAFLDSLRLRLLEETMPFSLGMRDKGHTVRQKMEILYRTLISLQFPEKLNSLSREEESLAHYEKARGYQTFFAQLVALMDKMVDIFGEETMSLTELSQLFDAGLETLSLTSPPLSMDQVILGDLKRTRLPEIRVLFFVGMNDGEIPPVPEDGGILNDEDKRILSDLGINLSLNLTERVLEDEYYLYLAFSKPRDELWLCCCKTGADGDARRPSSLFHAISQIFPQIKMVRYPQDVRRYYFNEKDSREDLIRWLRSRYEGEKTDDKAFYSLIRYWQEEKPEELKEIWQSMSLGSQWPSLPEDTVEKLYGQDLSGSVSRMEEYASCPFRYFCDYGLGIRERKEFKVYAVDLGNLFHGALEYFSNLVKERGYRWKEIPEEVQDSLLDEAVDAVMDPGIRDVMDSSARNKYKKKMVRRILARTVKVLRYHLRNSSFEPDRFEVSFGAGNSLEGTRIPLEDGHGISLNGVIDRVDLCEEEDKIYLKIIDYKSGAGTFDANKMYYGLQMQLIVYMNAALEIYRKETGKEVEPAGIFYYQLQDPIQKESDVAADKDMNAFRMTGYASDDPEVIDRLEHGTRNLESFSLNITNAGIPDKRSNVWAKEDFYRAGRHVTETIKDIGERIFSGGIKASPYRLGDDMPCSYCPYSSVCGYEADDPRQEVRILAKYKKEDIMEKIREEVKEDGLHP
ncbi:MAG: PD-(D/E)XK nuclease family protein, partial [Eubacterium sp.]|nr:PD-(D/E)XK nuclease family protein [Eubacterium sp.]